jgi:hypothetical protein
VGQSEAKNQRNTSLSRVLVLIGGDLLALLLFVWIGRDRHSLSTADIRAGLVTAAPFVMSWFLITPWFGLFQAGVSQNWRKLVPRLLLAWVIIGGPLALVLRALFLGRSIPGGILPTFAAVTLTVTTLFTLIWRLGYIGWNTYRQNQQQDAENLNV